METLLQLKNLVHLDISKDPVPEHEEEDDKEVVHYPAVSGELLEMLASLPKLMSLDVSGKNTF